MTASPTIRGIIRNSALGQLVVNLDAVFGTIDRWLGQGGGDHTIRGLRYGFGLLARLINDDLPEIGGFEPDVVYRDVDGKSLTLDVAIPQGDGPFPVLVYLHGGAWICGSPATHRKLTHRLAERGFLTLSVDYRLAPEHPFPAGFNDCIHAIHFARQNACRWGGNPEAMVLAGDSAGANLAAACAIQLKGETAAPEIRGIGLLYGVYDFGKLDDDGLSAELMTAYLGDSRDLITDPRVSPIGKASQLPPAFVAIGSDDPLIEDAEALRTKLEAAGVIHDYRVYPDMPHAFMQIELLGGALPAIDQLCAFLRKTLAD